MGGQNSDKKRRMIDDEIYRFLGCKSWLFLNFGHLEELVSGLKAIPSEELGWDSAAQKKIANFIQKAKVKTDWETELRSWNSMHTVTFCQLFEHWAVIESDHFRNINQVLRVLEYLSKLGVDMYNFYYDPYFGYERWIVYEMGQLKAIAEREDDVEFTVWGTLDQAVEALIEREEDYFDMIDVIEYYQPILSLISIDDLLEKQVKYYIGPLKLDIPHFDLDATGLKKFRKRVEYDYKGFHGLLEEEEEIDDPDTSPEDFVDDLPF